MAHNLKLNVIAEDSIQDEMLTLRALNKINLAPVVDVARDDQQALDYLFGEGEFSEFAETVARLGIYWIATNQPPPR